MSSTRKTVAAFFAALVLASGFATTSPVTASAAMSDCDGSLCAWEHAGANGDRFEVEWGGFTYGDLSAQGWNDKISSVLTQERRAYWLCTAPWCPDTGYAYHMPGLHYEDLPGSLNDKIRAIQPQS